MQVLKLFFLVWGNCPVNILVDEVTASFVFLVGPFWFRLGFGREGFEQGAGDGETVNLKLRQRFTQSREVLEVVANGIGNDSGGWLLAMDQHVSKLSKLFVFIKH